jgi:nitrate/nitrite transporter NarK
MRQSKMSEEKSNLWINTIFPFSLGYFITMVFRSINAILAYPIEQSLNLNPVEIGFVTLTYSLAFALTQIPLGVLLNSWGPRKMQSFFLFWGRSESSYLG